MARPRSFPSYRLHSASGQAIVEINCRTYYLGPHGSQESKDKYADLIRQYNLSGMSPNFTPHAGSPSLAELFDAYVDHARSYYGVHRKSKFHDYCRLILRVAKTHGLMDARDFRPSHFKAIRDELINEGCTRLYIQGKRKRVGEKSLLFEVL